MICLMIMIIIVIVYVVWFVPAELIVGFPNSTTILVIH